jgi:Mg2+ and Co2+ transporter CorA
MKIRKKKKKSYNRRLKKKISVFLKKHNFNMTTVLGCLFILAAVVIVLHLMN